MDFELTEEQLALRAVVKEFTAHEIEPLAIQMDRDGRLPDDVIVKMAGIGLFGLTTPKEWGGMQAGNLSSVLACEQLAYSGTGAWWLVAFNNSIPECIATFGSKAAKARYIKPLLDGASYASLQFTEEETGSDPDALATTATADGNHYVINGTKRFSTFGARDGCAILFAKDEAGDCSAFLVNKNVEGYTSSRTWELMGSGGIEAADVQFNSVTVPKTDLLGQKGKGFEVLRFWIAIEKMQQCAACVGIAQAAFDEALKYARSRRVRGRPISGMQGIRWMLADLQPKIQAARLLTYRVAFLKDRGSNAWMTEAAAAKLFVVPVMLEVTEIARRIHGSYGYTREFKIERLCRAAAGATGIATSLEINRSIVGSSLLTD